MGRFARAPHDQGAALPCVAVIDEHQTFSAVAECQPAVQAAFAMNDVTEVAVVENIETLFRLHYGRLVRALTLVCGDREQAADAVQEAFVKAHLRWRRLQHYDDPVGWIRRVAVNGLRDHHRRNTRKSAAMDRLGSLTTTVADDAAADDPMSDEGIMQLLNGLPKQQRLSLALFYVDGLSVAETAATLGISEGAVKFHLHQGREKLRGQLDPRGIPS
jgi:RNA polymerase sigma-70 factor (ECF subfamily)